MISIFFILNRMKIGNDRRAELEGSLGASETTTQISDHKRWNYVFTFLQKIGAKIGAAIYTAKRFVKNKSTNLKTKRVTTGKKGKKRKNNKEKKGHREGQNPNTSGTTKQADPAAAAGKNEIKMETQQHPNLPKAQGGDMAL